MLQAGALLGNYQIKAPLGHGGMGVVYEAIQLSLSRDVALKVIAADLSGDERFRERFRREGQSQAALDHSNVVTVIEAGEADGRLFLAMQLVRGPSLKELINRGELDLGRIVRLLGPIADALDTAHEAGLIHRDLKPQNILVGSRDKAYLADFGLTQALGAPGLTRTGQFVGTLDYIAPEQIHGRPATAASDVYAFGAVLFECLTGEVPYPRESDAAILFAHVSEPPPRVSALRPDIPAQLDAVLSRAMAKEPEKRFDSATAVMQALADAVGEATPRAAPPAGEPQRSGSSGDRAPGGAASASFGVAPEPAPSPTIVDRPPRASAVGPRPVAPRSRRPLVLAAVAAIAIAAATGAGLALSTDKAPPAPSAQEQAHTAYVAAVDRAVRDLAAARADARAKLIAARTPPAREAAADALAQVYADGGRALAAIRAPSADAGHGRALTQAADTAREQYAALADAIERSRTADYAHAAAAAGAAETVLNHAVRALHEAGR